MILKSVSVGDLQTNCYLLGCPETKKGVIVDPGAEPDKIGSMLDESGIEVIAIVLTHGHYDHTGAISIRDVPVFVHKSDEFLLKASNGWLPQGIQDAAILKKLKFLEDGQEIIFGQLKVKVVHTPGHSPGSISLLSSDFLLSGDTLFAQGVGRTDLPGGSSSQLSESISKKIMMMADNIRVFPGHGPQTTIGMEREGNIFA